MKHVFTVASALMMLVLTAAAGAQQPAREPAGTSGGFSLASLRGSYALEFSGKFKSGDRWVPMMGTGVIAADGRGHLRGAETYSTDTQACDAALSGTYTIEPDGRGTVRLTFTPATPDCVGGTYTQSLAIANHGALVLLSNTNAGNLIEEKWYLQRPQALVR